MPATTSPERETPPASTLSERETPPADDAAPPEGEGATASALRPSVSPRDPGPDTPHRAVSGPATRDDDRPGESRSEHREPRWGRYGHLRRGGLTVAGLVAAALVGLAVPGLVDWVSLRLSSPVVVTVIDPMHIWQPDFTPMYVRPGVMSLDQVRTWPVSWVPGDGIAVENQRVRLAVSNRRAEPVTIVDLRVEVDAAGPKAADGTLFAVSHAQGGPGDPDVQASVNLDEVIPVVRAGTDDRAGPAPLSDSAITLAPGQTTVLSVTAHLEKGTREWRLAVDLQADGKRRVIRAPQGDPPFRISARRPRYEAGFRGELDGPKPGWSPLEDCHLVGGGEDCPERRG